jgi:hypothetical protein
MIRYIRAHPFSIMALCNIVGDGCYLGYAFDAVGFVSAPKLAGALFATFAHIILLAYGDDQANKIAHEHGAISNIILKLRILAQRLAAGLPPALGKYVRAKPVGWPFLMLTMNGVGLAADALLELSRQSGGAMDWQLLSGTLIALGCGSFALADFVKDQGSADKLTKIAPSILACATFSNAGLTIATLNPFLLIGVVVFMLSNFAGFFTRIDKEEGQHLHS